VKALVLGATGFLGSAICRKLLARGYETSGLFRSPDGEAKLVAAGVRPIAGSLDRPEGLSVLVREFDVVVFAAMIPFDVELRAIQIVIEALSGTSCHLLFTSGTGVLAIKAENGAWDENCFAEDDPFPFPPSGSRAARIETENLVRAASGGGLHTTVIRPPLIYGHGGSVQIPRLFESAIKTGEACYLGQGLNLYSNVHVDDLAEVYCLAIERGTPGALYHAVAGEANFRSLAEAVAEVVGCGTRSLDLEAARSLWGHFWVDLGLAVNSRSRAPRTLSELGWRPAHTDVIDDIRQGSYRDAYTNWREGRGGLLKISSHG
jgi:nucleoside-diphosphate-sugar epimerase